MGTAASSFGKSWKWKGERRVHAHGRVITALDRAPAPTARNSDYPTAPQHWSDTGDVQEAQMDPGLAQDPGPRWLLLLWSANPCFFQFRSWQIQVCVCTPSTTAPEGGSWKKQPTTSQSSYLGLIWVWGLSAVVFFLVKALLFSCTT